MKLFTLLFLFLMTAQAQIKPVDQQYMNGENYLLNAGFESGRTNWSETGTAVDTLESSIVRFGAQSYKIVATAQTVNLSQIVTKYAAQSGGQQGIVSVFIKNTNPLLKVCAVSNSVDTNCLDVLPNDEWREYAIPFVLSATNNGIRIKSASDSGTTYIDNAFVGVMPATRMPEISQAQTLANIYFATTSNCRWDRSNTAMGDYTADVDCPAPLAYLNESSTVTLTDTDLPQFTLNVKAGRYVITSYVYNSTSVASSVVCNRISDGTTNGANSCGFAGSGSAPFISASAVFDYTSAGSKTIKLQGSASSGINYIENLAANQNVSFVVKYYPPKSKIYSGDTIYPHAQLLGKVNYATTASCIWSMTGTTITNFAADTDCANPTATGGVLAPATKIPAVVLPVGSPKGTYKFVANGSFYAAPSANSFCGFRLSDGTNSTSLGYIGNSTASSGFSPNIVGEIEYSSSLSSNTTVQIQAREYDGNAARCDIESAAGQQELTISVYYFPPRDNPIIGTFANVVTAPNIAKPKTCYYAFGGASATLASPTVCAASPCVEVYDSCSAATAPTRLGTGEYLLNFASGTWKNNTPISCKCESFNTTTMTDRFCNFTFRTGEDSWSTDSSGGYSPLVIVRVANTLNAADTYNMIECTADAP
jgi:hypothetical protein